MPVRKFDTIEQVYKDQEIMGKMLGYAAKHIYKRDQALDVVHDVLAKALDYQNRNPDRKIKDFILYRELARACRRFNKASQEISSGLFNEEENEAD